MKRNHALVALAMVVSTASLGFAPETACAQRPGGGGGPMQVNSVEFLVSESDALALSTEQEESLKVIAADLAVEVEPIREEMRAARGGGGGREAMMAIRDKIQEADAKALALAMVVLSEDQRETAKKLLESRPRRRGPGG